MISSKLSTENLADHLLSVGEDLIPLPTYKLASTTSHNFSNLLSKPLQLHEDLKSGCGGQIWPAGMVLAKHMLRYHKNSLADKRILELGAGGGLVGLAVGIECNVKQPIYISDQENMIELMRKNIEINELQSQVQELVLDWGGQLPVEILKRRPNLIFAADCVYFEPAFPLLLATMKNLAQLCENTIIYFCFKKRRRADMNFMKNARKIFLVEEPEDEDRKKFSIEGIFLYKLKLKSW